MPNSAPRFLRASSSSARARRRRPGVLLGLDHDARPRRLVLRAQLDHGVSHLAVLDEPGRGARVLEGVPRPGAGLGQPAQERALEGVAVGGGARLRLAPGGERGELRRHPLLEAGDGLGLLGHVVHQLLAQARQGGALGIEGELLADLSLGPLHPLHQPRQRGILLVQGELLHHAVDAALEAFGQLPVVLAQLAHQPRQGPLAVVQGELREDPLALGAQGLLHGAVHLGDEPLGVVGVEQAEQRAPAAHVLGEGAGQGRIRALHVLADHPGELSVLVGQALDPLAEAPAGRIEVLAQGLLHLALEGAAVPVEAGAQLAEHALHLAAHGLGVHLAARGAQGEHADAQRRQGEGLALAQGVAVGELLRHLRVAHAQGDLEGLADLRGVGVDVVTVGQYLRPTARHLPVARWWTPEEFEQLKTVGEGMGIAHVESSPLTRSSYHARQAADAAAEAGA